MKKMKFDDLSRDMICELKQTYSLMSDDEIRALVGDCEFIADDFKSNSRDKGVAK